MTGTFVDVGATPDEVVVYLTGDLDVASAHAPIEVGLRALDSGPVTRLVVDLAEVGFIDSSGLGGLVQLSNLAETRGVAVYVRRSSERIVALLKLSGLDAILPRLEDAGSADQ